MQFLRDNVFLVGVVAVLLIGLAVLLALYLDASSGYDKALEPRVQLAREISNARLVRPDPEINAQIRDRQHEIDAARAGVKDVMGGRGLRPVMRVQDNGVFDAFPVANKYIQNPAKIAFTAAYVEECQQMLSVLNPAGFISKAKYDEWVLDEEKLVIQAMEEEKRAQDAAATTPTTPTGGGGGNPMPPDYMMGGPNYAGPQNYAGGPPNYMGGPGVGGVVSKDARTRAAENTTARVQLLQARSGRIYASPASLDRHWDRREVITQRLPSIPQLWEAQVNLWTQKDLIIAIYIVNDAAQRNVAVEEAIDGFKALAETASKRSIDPITAINLVNKITNDAANRGVDTLDAFTTVVTAADAVSAAAQGGVDLFTGNPLRDTARKTMDMSAAVDRIEAVAKQNGIRPFDLAVIVNAATRKGLKTADAIAIVKTAAKDGVDLFDAAALLTDATRKGINVLDVIREQAARDNIALTSVVNAVERLVTAAARRGFDPFDANTLLAAAAENEMDLLAALTDAAVEKEIKLEVRLPQSENSVLTSGVRALENIKVNRQYVTGGASSGTAGTAAGGRPSGPPPPGPYGGPPQGPYGAEMYGTSVVPTGPSTVGFTGRGSGNKDASGKLFEYDVVHYNVTVVMPPQRILDLTKALYSLGFHTVLNVEFTALAAPSGTVGVRPGNPTGSTTGTDTSVVPLYYGPGALARVTISGELLLPMDVQRGVFSQTDNKWVVEPLVPYEVLQTFQEKAPGALRPEDLKRINENNMQPAAARP